jgi:hypothetical protein
MNIFKNLLGLTSYRSNTTEIVNSNFNIKLAFQHLMCSVVCVSLFLWTMEGTLLEPIKLFEGKGDKTHYFQATRQGNRLNLFVISFFFFSHIEYAFVPWGDLLRSTLCVRV